MFRWNEMKDVRVVLGLILSFLSFMLLVTAAASTPFTKQLYFLNANGMKFGTFGYCLTDKNDCSKHLGYTSPNGGNEIMEWSTKAILLFVPAALFMDVAFVFLLLSLLKSDKVKWSRKSIYYQVTSTIGAICAVLAEIFALTLWVTAKNRFESNGIQSTYGAALWVALVGAILTPIAAIVGRPPKSRSPAVTCYV